MNRRGVFLGSSGETNGYAQARPVVRELDRCAVQVGHGLDEREAQAVAGCCPARFEAIETPENLLAFRFRYAAPGIGDAEDRDARLARERYGDRGTGRTVPDR